MRSQGLYSSAMLLSIGDVASRGVTGLLALLVARYLGPSVYGEYATASSIAGLFMIVTFIGFEQELTRRGGRDPARIPEALALTFRALLLTCLLAGACMLAFAFLDVYTERVRHLIVLAGLAAIVVRFHLPFRYLCLLLRDSRRMALIQSLASVLLLALTAVLILLHGTAEQILAAQVVVAALALVVWLRWLPASLRELGSLRGGVLRFVRASAPFAASNLIWIAYFNFDTLLLSLLRSTREVGIYAGVYRIVGINYVLGYALANSFTPLLFEHHVRASEEYGRVARRLVRSTVVVGLVLGAGLYAASGWLVTLLVGKEYAAGIVIAQVLSAAVFFRVVNYGLCEILTTSDRQRTRNLLEGSLLAVNVGLNLLLIPSIGALGSAVATVAAEVVLFTGAGIACWRIGALRSRRLEGATPVAPTAAARGRLARGPVPTLHAAVEDPA